MPAPRKYASTAPFGIRLPPSQLNRIRADAVQAGVSLGAYVASAIEAALPALEESVEAHEGLISTTVNLPLDLYDRLKQIQHRTRQPTLPAFLRTVLKDLADANTGPD